MTGILAFLIKLSFGGMVDKAFTHMERRAELANDTERLKTTATIELARELVNEAQIMAEFNRAKLAFPWFWVLVFAVGGPLILWETAVVFDSIPYLRDVFGDQQVYDLPTPALQEAFARMIEWVFYVGSGVGVWKTLTR
ncbi:hypothetical protein [Ruegeria sp. HKCCD8929]|uniref:hypothetical protein n=1 Tax=Ruegeria sp. HKCCD8929 TaxID=2683006 RepID=UPI001488D0DD|nr:hypothetical protein [Ruegeria sp. HKCCD8929]